MQSQYYDPNVLNNTDKNLLSVNLFAYCENNPVNASDADGHFLWLLAVAAFIPGLDVIVGVAAAVVGAVVVGTMISQAISRHQNHTYLAKKRMVPIPNMILIIQIYMQGLTRKNKEGKIKRKRKLEKQSQ